jgi:hypothetical protein
MSEHASGQSIWSGIDIPKTVAGVLAAVSAAVVGSFLGVAGTLAGAAVASIVGSVGTEIYHRWINRGSKKIRESFVAAPAAVGTPQVVAAAEEKPSGPPAKLRWGRVAAVAASVFVLAIGTLTVFELVSGKTAADAVGHKTSSSTTISQLLHGGSSKSTDTTPTTSPSSDAPTTSGSTTPTTAPTDQASTPADQATTQATTEAPTPTATDTAPTQAPATDNQTQQSDGGQAGQDQQGQQAQTQGTE